MPRHVKYVIVFELFLNGWNSCSCRFQLAKSFACNRLEYSFVVVVWHLSYDRCVYVLDEVGRS